MGLFSKKTRLDFSSIVSVVILEQTQLYKGQSNWGMSFGSTLGDGRVIAMNENVPAGAEIKFSVTFKDGHKEIIKAMSGTDVCTKLLQMAIDPSTEMPSSDEPSKEYVPVQLQKNQLPNGKYVIGEEIPAGTYDFTWVFGNGSIHIFKDKTDTKTLGASRCFQWIGNRYDYEFRQCLNVNCEQGNVMVILHLRKLLIQFAARWVIIVPGNLNGTSSVKVFPHSGHSAPLDVFMLSIISTLLSCSGDNPNIFPLKP